MVVCRVIGSGGFAMAKMLFNKNGLALFASLTFVALCFFLNDASVAANQPAPAVNLYQDVMSHKASINWQNAPAENYPDDACSVIDACSADRSAPKVFVLPSATIDGHRVGRAVYLVKVKGSEALVFEHQSSSTVYFFRVGPDGNIMKTAYFERGGNWLLIANQLGQPIYNKDAVDWQAALDKTASSAKSGF
jgi:hypothetical protein